MTGFIFKDYSCNMYNVLLENGSLYKHDIYSEKKAIELLTRWYPEHNLVMIKKPWDDPEVKQAMANYEAHYELPFSGRLRE